jgi:protein SCO1/2
VLVALLAGCGGSHQAATPPSKPAAPQLRGLIPEPLPVKPSFTLTDTSGRPYNFRAETQGKLTYLYFGYTHCPDACPATMSDLTYALRLQPPRIRRRVVVVFVTVDPRRDTPKVLRTWLNHYNRSFVGLGGTEAQLAVAERQAGVPPAPREKETGKNYSVPHSTLLFPYSPDDRAHVVYAQGFKPVDFAHDIPILLRFTHRGS